MNEKPGRKQTPTVTQGDYFDIHPNPSVDGDSLYFATTRNGRLGIWSLKLNGKGGLRTVTMGNTADYGPALKPRSEHIFYSAVLPGSTAPAYIWNRPANGGMPEQLSAASLSDTRRYIRPRFPGL